MFFFLLLSFFLLFLIWITLGECRRRLCMNMSQTPCFIYMRMCVQLLIYAFHQFRGVVKRRIAWTKKESLMWTYIRMQTFIRIHYLIHSEPFHFESTFYSSCSNRNVWSTNTPMNFILYMLDACILFSSLFTTYSFLLSIVQVLVRAEKNKENRNKIISKITVIGVN